MEVRLEVNSYYIFMRGVSFVLFCSILIYPKPSSRTVIFLLPIIVSHSPITIIGRPFDSCFACELVSSVEIDNQAYLVMHVCR